MNDFQRAFFEPTSITEPGPNGGDGNIGSSTAPKKRILSQFNECGLTAHSFDPMMLRPEAEVVAAEGLASVSFDPNDVGVSTEGFKSKKKQRGHRRTMDYLQNFSIQALMSLGQNQNGQESPAATAAAAATITSTGSRLNVLARPNSIADVTLRYQPPFHQSPYISAVPPPPPPSSSAGARTRRKSGGARAEPKEGTTLPPKPVPPKSAYKNIWPTAMLANVVSLAQILMTTTTGGAQAQADGATCDDSGESVGATGSVTTHGDPHGRQPPGSVEPPADALASRSLSTDSHDSRAMRQMWNDHLRIGENKDTWRDCPTPDAGKNGQRPRSSS